MSLRFCKALHGNVHSALSEVGVRLDVMPDETYLVNMHSSSTKCHTFVLVRSHRRVKWSEAVAQLQSSLGVISHEVRVSNKKASVPQQINIK